MEQAVQNHSVDRVVEAFLLVNPDAARTPAEVEGLAKAGKDRTPRAWELRGGSRSASRKGAQRDPPVLLSGRLPQRDHAVPCLPSQDPQNMAVLRWLLRDKGAEELRRIATPLRANRYREDQYHRSERRRSGSSSRMCAIS